MKTTSTQAKPTQEELKKIEQKIEEFSLEMQRSLPPGLNSPLTRSEKALLRTYALFNLNAYPLQDHPSKSSPTE
jgi:hypothetical protein